MYRIGQLVRYQVRQRQPELWQPYVRSKLYAELRRRWRKHYAFGDSRCRATARTNAQPERQPDFRCLQRNIRAELVDKQCHFLLSVRQLEWYPWHIRCGDGGSTDQQRELHTLVFWIRRLYYAHCGPRRSSAFGTCDYTVGKSIDSCSREQYHLELVGHQCRQLYRIWRLVRQQGRQRVAIGRPHQQHQYLYLDLHRPGRHQQRKPHCLHRAGAKRHAQCESHVGAVRRLDDIDLVVDQCNKLLGIRRLVRQ